MVEIVNNANVSEVKKPSRPHIVALALPIFLRMLGLVVLGVSILLWSQVLGFQGADIQKTFIANEFQGLVLAVLAIATPLLGVGLWLGMSWARILWGLLAAGLLMLHHMGHPLTSGMLTFAYALLALFALYYLAQLFHILTTRRSKERSKK